jgi:hypothetical protein
MALKEVLATTALLNSNRSLVGRSITRWRKDGRKMDPTLFMPSVSWLQVSFEPTHTFFAIQSGVVVVVVVFDEIK